MRDNLWNLVHRERVGFTVPFKTDDRTAATFECLVRGDEVNSFLFFRNGLENDAMGSKGN